MERPMMKFGLLGAAVILSSALAGPAMAQQAVKNAAADCATADPNADCRTLAPGNRHAGKSHQRHMAGRQGIDSNRDPNWNNGWHDSWNDNRRHDSGFWPGDVAAGVVGGAIGTAGAIATAPFRNDGYAYDAYAYDSGYGNGYYGGPRGWDNRTYGQRNGFVCEPGTWFKGEDGLMHPCQ